MDLKHFIYFGLGACANIPFTLRSLSQWFLSEYRQKSHVTRSFWWFSIVGNTFMLAHYLMQVQFHLFFIRIFPFYFGFRQLFLMQKKASLFSWKKFSKHILSLIFICIALFMARSFFEYKRFLWVLNPTMPWETSTKIVSVFWHILGFVGAGLFTSRMWVQWWQSEKAQESTLSSTFWLISLVGGSLTLIYAIYIKDPMTAIGYSVGLIPYIRNLMLIRKERISAEG